MKWSPFWTQNKRWWLIPRKRGFLGRLMVSSCTLVGGCRVRCLMRTPYFTLGRRRSGLRTAGLLLALSAFYVFPLWLHASLPRTYDCLLSLMSTNCLGLRPPAAMTDGWFPPVQDVSSAGLCNTFWAATITLPFLVLAEGKCFGHAYVFHLCDVANPTQDSMLDRLALLRTSSFDT